MTVDNGNGNGCASNYTHSHLPRNLYSGYFVLFTNVESRVIVAVVAVLVLSVTL